MTTQRSTSPKLMRTPGICRSCQPTRGKRESSEIPRAVRCALGRRQVGQSIHQVQTKRLRVTRPPMNGQFAKATSESNLGPCVVCLTSQTFTQALRAGGATKPPSTTNGATPNRTWHVHSTPVAGHISDRPKVSAWCTRGGPAPMSPSPLRPFAPSPRRPAPWLEFPRPWARPMASARTWQVQTNQNQKNQKNRSKNQTNQTNQKNQKNQKSGHVMKTCRKSRCVAPHSHFAFRIARAFTPPSWRQQLSGHRPPLPSPGLRHGFPDLWPPLPPPPPAHPRAC